MGFPFTPPEHHVTITALLVTGWHEFEWKGVMRDERVDVSLIPCQVIICCDDDDDDDE